MVYIKELKRVDVTGERWILYEITTTPNTVVTITFPEGTIIT